MGIIEQTNRTILFDVVNPEVFNMFNIMSDVDENSRSLTDEKFHLRTWILMKLHIKFDKYRNCQSKFAID